MHWAWAACGYTFYEGNVLCFPVHFSFSRPFISTLVAASISHFLTAALEFPCFSSEQNGSPLFFISRSSSLSVVLVNVDIGDKFSRKKDSALLLFNFSLQKSRRPCVLPPKHAGAWNAKFILAYMKGWTYVGCRKDDFVRTNIFSMHR